MVGVYTRYYLASGDRPKSDAPVPKTKTKTAPATVKISANLPVEVLGALRELAYSRGTTVTEALSRAVQIDSYLSLQESEGAKILIEDRNNNIRRVIRK